MGFPSGSESKASAYNAGDSGSIPGSGRSSGEGNGNPFQHSCLDICLDGESDTTEQLHFHFHFQGLQPVVRSHLEPCPPAHPRLVINNTFFPGIRCVFLRICFLWGNKAQLWKVFRSTSLIKLIISDRIALDILFVGQDGFCRILNASYFRLRPRPSEKVKTEI